MLQDENFPVWKAAIKSYLSMKNLLVHLTTDVPAPTADRAMFHKEQRKTVGVLTMYMGYANVQRLVNAKNKQKPSVLWALLTNRYKSHSKDNQACVYTKFLELTFTKDIQSFLTDINSHISALTAVGLRIGNESDGFVHLYKPLMAEYILSKLPSTLEVTREIIHSKLPLTLKLVMKRSTQSDKKPRPTRQ